MSFVENLRNIIDKTGAKIVISSTWKMSGLQILKEMWVGRNLPGEIIDITPNEVDVVDRGTCEFYDLVDRGYEIQQLIINQINGLYWMMLMICYHHKKVILYDRSKKTQKSLASVMNLKINQKVERIFNI